MRQQPEHTLALAQREPRLQQPDLLHRQRETARQRGARHLVHGDAVGGAALCLRRVHALCLQLRQCAAVRRPQQHRVQERRRDRLVVGHARVGIAQPLHQHAPQRAGTVGGQRLRGFRQQRGQQTMRFQVLEAGHRVTGQEQLEGLLEQPRRRGIGQQRRQPRQRFGGGGLDAEAQLRRQPRRPQHAHRIFAVARFRLADQAQQPCLHVGIATDVVAHREVLDRVVQRIGGEVAAHRVVLDAAVDVVAQQAAAVVGLAIPFVVAAVGAEGGDLDDLAPIDHVRQPEPAADQAAVAEQRLDLLRRGVGGDVEVLGFAADQQVAHRAAHQVGAEPGFAQAIQHPQCVGTHLLAGHTVDVARNHAQFRDDGEVGAFELGHALRLAETGRCQRQTQPFILASSTRPPAMSGRSSNRLQQCSLRLEAQDVALSRLKHGFESRRERHTTKKPRVDDTGFFVVPPLQIRTRSARRIRRERFRTAVSWAQGRGIGMFRVYPWRRNRLELGGTETRPI